jgi:uncharacterized membrane protein SpoIIM required for sporulation/uncharacterized RDD family membrane protein YckC
MPEPRTYDYRQHLALETPEHVVLDYEIAGVGSRVLAALADWLLVFVMVLVAVMGVGIFLGKSGWAAAIVIATVYAILWGYFTLFEGLWQGQTPGKRWLGIRVIRETGHGVTLSDAAARNLLLPIDALGAIGVILIAVHPRGRRLGDLIAGTVVVRDKPMEAATPSAPNVVGDVMPEESGTPQLSDEEFRLLREFSARAPTLPPAVRANFAHQFAERFAARYHERSPDDLVFLRALYDSELARRRGRFGARSTGTPGTGSGRSVAERLVARKSARWDDFQVMAGRVTKGGLDALAASELPDFAARYREVAADLARARTYGADAPIVGRLERLVAAGHSALYRAERRTWQLMWQFVSRECPGAIITSWRYILLAFLCFMLPAAGGYALLRDRPELAPELLPDVMLERAEAGAARTQAGKGYVLAPGSDRPVMAASIITNNIKVAFMVFAGGAVLGFGSLVLLAANGLSIGAASGHFANVGMLGYLWTFIIGHGFLELFAIWVAGAAGFLLGRAIIMPGDLPRKDALVFAGRTAMRLIGAVMVLLLVAGTIEGFISSSGWSVQARAMVSGASVVFLAIYLLNGTRRVRAPISARG